jgi:predicted transposase/invertase (TIGR01784 family)
MQKAKQNYFKDRSVYYSTFPIQQQAQQGSWDFKLKAVYTIGILDFVFDESQDSDVFHSEIKLMNTRTKRVFFDKLIYIYLEMPKFTKIQSELTTHFEKWLYLLKNLEKLNDKPKAMESSIFNKLFEQAEIACYSESEYQEYEKSLKTYRYLKNSIDSAFDDGFVEGEETGLSLKEIKVLKY